MNIGDHVKSGRLRKLNLPTVAALFVCAVFFVVVFYIAHKKYLCLDVTHFDIQQMTQIFEMARSDGVFAAINFNPTSWFFLTLEPLQYVGMLFYAVIPSVYTLLVLQIGALTAALFLSYLLAVQISRNPWVGLVVIIALACNAYLWAFALMGWRSYLLSAPFFPAFFLARAKGWPGLSALLLVFAGLGKVNLMFMAVLIGLLAWRREPKARHAKTPFLICAALLACMLIIAAFLSSRYNVSVSAKEVHLAAYGETVGEAFVSMATRPIFTIKQIFIEANAAHLALLLSFLFIPVLAGGYFLCALPEIAMIFLTTSGMVPLITYQNVYAGIYSPNIFIHNNYFYLTGILMACFAMGASALYKYFRENSFGMMNAPYMMLSVVFLTFVARIIWPPMIAGPLPLNIHYDGRYYEQTAHDKLGWEIPEAIPEGAFVRAQWNLFPKSLMRGRGRLRSFEWFRNDVVEDYIYVDLFSFEYLMERNQYLDDLEKIVAGGQYGVTQFEDGYILLKKGHDSSKNAEVTKFIEENRTILEKNLFRPYQDRNFPEPKVGHDVYSETQLAGREGS